MDVIFTPKVLSYFENLIIILYDKEYFSFLETSKKYVEDLIDDIKSNISTKQHKPAPRHFDKYGKGMKYASFKKSRHTTWYVFFKTYEENGNTIFLVRYIANNHVIAQYL